MGTFLDPITLIGAAGERVTVDALVDTGATFTAMPGEQLMEIGVRPAREARLRLKDGSVRVQRLGEARVEVDETALTTIVVFGERGSPTIGALGR